MSRLHIIGMMGVVLLLSFLLVKVRYQAQEVEEEVASIERQIDEERQNIRVLRAEWSYLTRPEKLQELVTRYSGMRPTARAQLAAWSDMPVPVPAEALADISPAAGLPAAPEPVDATVTKPAAQAPKIVATAEKKPSIKKTKPSKPAASVWDALPEKVR